MIPSPETQAKIALWRQKAVEGTLTKEEMREALVLMRGERRSAAVASETARKTAARKVKPQLDGDDLLAELAGL